MAHKSDKPHRNGKSGFCVAILKKGGVGVMPTDTIYGLVGSALKKSAVERIYRLRRRDPKKPMIILIGSLKQLKCFGITPGRETARLLLAIWPGRKRHPYKLEFARMLFRGGVAGNVGRRPVSVILPINSPRAIRKFKYLHRGANTLAFRLPGPRRFRLLLRKTGPLVAPSANPEGRRPARTISEAKKYFGDKPDFYVDGGRRAGRPSRLVKIEDDSLLVLRK